MRIAHPYNPFYPLANSNLGLHFPEKPAYYFPDFEATSEDELYCVLKNGNEVLLREIQEDDKPLFVKFHSELTVPTLIRRYQWKPPLEERIKDQDKSKRILFIAKTVPAETNNPIIIGEGELYVQKDDKTVEVAITISDNFQRLGLGSIMLSQLEAIARRRGFRRIIAYAQDTNIPMIKMLNKARYRPVRSREGDYFREKVL